MIRTAARRLATTAAIIAGVMALTAGSALATECMNASKNAKNPLAGAQIVFSGGEISTMTNGLARRIEQGLVTLDGEGYRGIVGFDDGDMSAHIFVVGPDGSIPHQAQHNGPVCKGIVDIRDYFEQCVGD